MVLLTLIMFTASVLTGFVVFSPGMRPEGLLADAVFLACVLGFLLSLTLVIRQWIRGSVASHISRIEAEHDRLAQAFRDYDDHDSPSGASSGGQPSSPGESGRDSRRPGVMSSLSGARFAASYKSDGIREQE